MPEARTMEMAPLMQAASIMTVDEAERTVEVVFSTGALVPHWMDTGDGVRRVMTQAEVTPEAARLDRLNAGAPVLDAHDDWKLDSVLGSVQRAWIANGEARATLKFSEAESVGEIWQKVREGTIRNVSMGFWLHEAVVEMTQVAGKEREIWRLTDWEPYEISMVAIGADPGARVQKAAEPVSVRIIDKRGNTDMSNNQAPAATQSDNGQGAPLQQAAQAPHHEVDVAALQQQARADERARVGAIRQAGTALGLDEAVIQRAIDDGTEADAFRQSAITSYAERAGAGADRPDEGGHTQAAAIGGPRGRITSDASDRFRQGAAAGIMARAGLTGGERNEFTGATLSELARQSLALAGITRSFSNRMELVGQAFVQSAGGHSTSDFANVLANVMGKAALLGWEESAETWQVWTQTGTLTDFKPTKRVGTGVFSTLLKKEEGAEYFDGTFGDRGEPITLATYGRRLKVTREAIINDDLSLLADAPRKMGRAARRTIGNLVYAVITGNQPMSDGIALFHASHANLAGTGGVPSVASLSAARAAMRLQKDGDAAALNIAPKYLLVPAALETTATQLMRSTVDPQAQKGHAMNPIAGMAEVIAEPRLDADSSTAWYLTADPAMHDTVEVAFLDGVQEPYIEQRENWSTDGVDLKVRIDAGVGPRDYRGLYKDPGQ